MELIAQHDRHCIQMDENAECQGLLLDEIMWGHGVFVREREKQTALNEEGEGV